MSLSKPTQLVFGLVGAYFDRLYKNPVKTKSLTSCTIAMLGNLVSQYVTGAKKFDSNSLVAFGLFGILFGGTVPHYFYELLERVVVPHSAPRFLLKQLLIERLIFTPLYQMFVIYMLARFEGKNHDQSMRNLLMLYWPVLKANWTWLTIPQIINLRFIPPMLRVLYTNLMGFFWTIYLANKKRKAETRKNRLD